MKSRILWRSLALASLAASLAAVSHRDHEPLPAAGAPVPVTVFKDPNCGCCKLWIDHLRKHSFTVTVKDTSDINGPKRTARVPERLYSCHTAFVGGYVVEGHVPAEDIQRLLAEKPKIAGIAVPGMPAGSPGMEVGNRKDRYDVVAFNRDGTTRVFASH